MPSDDLRLQVGDRMVVLAWTLMGKLPQTIPTPLYPHQAFRLVRRLRKAQVQAQIAQVSSSHSAG